MPRPDRIRQKSTASSSYDGPPLEALPQRHVPPAALSRVSAYDWFGSLAFQPLGAAVPSVLRHHGR